MRQGLSGTERWCKVRFGIEVVPAMSSAAGCKINAGTSEEQGHGKSNQDF
jgi:hypothetical protein